MCGVCRCCWWGGEGGGGRGRKGKKLPAVDWITDKKHSAVTSTVFTAPFLCAGACWLPSGAVSDAPSSPSAARRSPGCWAAVIELIDWLMITYIALFSALLSRLTALACGSTRVTSFNSVFLNIHRSGVLTALAWLVPHETAAVSAQVLCTPYNHAPCHFMQSHIRKVYACLAATCHLHFWQNDRDLLRATAVTRGWNGYWNKSQHRKSTLEKKILPPLQQGFEPATFQSRVRRSNHWAIPAP